MALQVFSESIGQRFHVPAVPSLAACSYLRRPVVFSHVVSPTAMPAPTLAAPVDDVYSVHVHHVPIGRGDIWIAQRHREMPRVPEGGVFIFDLASEPTAQVHEPFAFSRFEFPRVAMDELAYEQGLRRVGELHAESYEADPIVQHVAQAMLRQIELFGAEEESPFRDYMTMALFAHLARAYGGVTGRALSPSRLGPLQLRRIEDWIDVHMHEAISIANLATLVDMSGSYFARAFTRSVGLPPHRWLLRKRIERAKRLLRQGAASLSEVAASCGFVDQSHLTRVFKTVEGTTPARWRNYSR